MEPVVITGVGVHGGAGDADAACAALAAGRSLLRDVADPAVPDLPAVPAVPAAPLDLDPWVADRKLRKYMNLTTQLAVVAAGRALAAAGLRDQPALRADCALFVATGLMSFDLSSVLRVVEASQDERGDLDLVRLGRDGLRQCHPLLPFQMLLNTPLGLVSIVHGLHGENHVAYPGPAQAGCALETAWRGLLHGRFPRALVGGAVDALGLLPRLTLTRRGELATQIAAARPFTAHHAGVAPADLGAFLVLETADAARARRAAPAGTMRSVGVTHASSLRETLEAPEWLWARVTRDAPPDRVLCTGAPDAAADERLRAAARRCWPTGTPPLRSPDGILGHGGAAALLLALSLATAEAGTTLVVALDPAGGQTAVTVGGRP